MPTPAAYAMHVLTEAQRWLQEQSGAPWFGGLAVPFLASLLATLVLSRVGRKLGTQVAGAGLGAGFLAAFVLLAGGVPFLRSLPYHAVGEVAVLALGCGLLAGAVGLAGRMLQIAAVAGTAAAILHVAGGIPSRASLESGRHLGLLLVVAGGALAAYRLTRPTKPPVLPLISLLAAAAGLAAIAGFGRALALAQLAQALAAASFAPILLCWPKPRFAIGAAALVPGAAILGALTQSSVIAAFSAPWPTLFLVLCFFPDEIAARLPGKGGKPSVPRLLVAAALPAFIAAAIAWYLARR